MPNAAPYSTWLTPPLLVALLVRPFLRFAHLSYEFLSDEKEKLAYDKDLSRRRAQVERDRERRSQMGAAKKGMVDDLARAEAEALRGRDKWMGAKGSRKEKEREAEVMRENLGRVRERERKEREEKRERRERKEREGEKKVRGWGWRSYS